MLRVQTFSLQHSGTFWVVSRRDFSAGEIPARDFGSLEGTAPVSQQGTAGTAPVVAAAWQGQQSPAVQPAGHSSRADASPCTGSTWGVVCGAHTQSWACWGLLLPVQPGTEPPESLGVWKSLQAGTKLSPEQSKRGDFSRESRAGQVRVCLLSQAR